MRNLGFCLLLALAVVACGCGSPPAERCSSLGVWFSNLEPGSDECAEYVRVWELAAESMGRPRVNPGTAWRVDMRDWPWLSVNGQLVAGETWAGGVIVIARFPWRDMTEERARAMPLRFRACASALAHEQRHAAEAVPNYAHIGWEETFRALQAFELFCKHGAVATW